MNNVKGYATAVKEDRVRKSQWYDEIYRLFDEHKGDTENCEVLYRSKEDMLDYISDECLEKISKYSTTHLKQSALVARRDRVFRGKYHRSVVIEEIKAILSFINGCLSYARLNLSIYFCKWQKKF